MKLILILFLLLISIEANAECAPQRTIKLPIEPHQYGDQYKEEIPGLRNKEIILSFDDGPHKKTTNQLLDYLKSRCLKVTFFIVGETARLNPDTLRREVAEGHSIGSHSHNHPMPFQKLKPVVAEAQIDNGIGEIQGIIGDKLKPWFRFPGLGYTKRDIEYLTGKGISVFGIDIEPADWQKPGNVIMMDRIMTQLIHKEKGIIILHDIHQTSVDFVPLLVDRLIAEGYTFVHIE